MLDIGIGLKDSSNVDDLQHQSPYVSGPLNTITDRMTYTTDKEDA